MNFDSSNTITTEVVNNQPITVSLVKDGQENAIQTANESLLTARDRIKNEIIQSGEAKRLSDTLSVKNPQSIVEFGRPVAEEISKCADDILRKQDISTLTQTGNMMATLNKIMSKVDIGEIKDMDKQPGFIGRMFNNAQQKIEKMMQKYNNIGNEIEKVCIELRTYERQIEQSNDDLDVLYQNGVTSYQQLVKYTIAGECAMEEVDSYISNLEATAVNDPTAQMELQNVRQVRDLLAQRIQDLRIAENVALQSLPIIKAMQFGNLNLARKINSSFIITIPIFKNACAQAILAKRQAIQAQAMKALDDKTNEMLMKNAQNAADNMRLTAQLAGSSSIKIETIENSWNTIMSGIVDTKNIQNELSRQRESDKQKIEEINKKFLSQVK